MKHVFRTLFWLLVLGGSAPSRASAQTDRNNNKSSNVYWRSYQRVVSGHESNTTFEIRGGTLWSWGDGGSGQPGDGIVGRSTPHK